MVQMTFFFFLQLKFMFACYIFSRLIFGYFADSKDCVVLVFIPAKLSDLEGIKLEIVV